MIERRLGRYEIVRQIGEGGMGVVFAARDTELDRDVAIKILPDELAADDRRQKRFEREAKAIAALDHPNICTLYDVGRENGTRFLVLELLEGQSLAERLDRGPLPLEDTLRIGAEIADALGHAHGAGIVHRDLKPGNVMLTKRGAKLLDFGIAHVLRSEPEVERDALTLTQDGEILGTLLYMAPEQVEGKPTEARTDVFALGAVLYEMVTGRRAFEGNSRASLAAAILSGEPRPIRELQPETPVLLEHVIRRCLEKNPDRRWQSAIDVANELRWVGDRGWDRTLQGAHLDPSGLVRRWRVAALSLAIVGAGLTGFVAWRALQEAPADSDRRTAPVAHLRRLTWEAGAQWYPSISPEGSSFAYFSAEAGNSDIYFRRIGGERALNLTADCEERDSWPDISPDGNSIVYRSDCGGGGLFVMGSTGESKRRLTDFGMVPKWSPDGRSIVFGDIGESGKRGIWVADAVAAGTVRRVFDGKAYFPAWSPSGTRIAFFLAHAPSVSLSNAIVTIPAAGGEPTLVRKAQVGFLGHVAWSVGWIWFTTLEAGEAEQIWRMPMDDATGVPKGDPEPVTISTSRMQAFDTTIDGQRLICTSVTETTGIVRYEFDPALGRPVGDATVVMEGPRVFDMESVSPDGRWVATTFQREDAYADVELVRVATGETHRVTFDVPSVYPIGWSADSSRIYVDAGEYMTVNEVWSLAVDGSGRELVARSPDGAPFEGYSVDLDERRLYGYLGEDETFCAIDLTVPFDARKPVPLPKLPDGSIFESLGSSPDGRRLLGVARNPGRSNKQIVLYDVETMQYRSLTTLPAEPLDVEWLPDSRRVLVNYEISDTRRAFAVLDTESGVVTPTATIDDRIRVVSLSRDGRWLFAERFVPKSHIWMLDYRESK